SFAQAFASLGSDLRGKRVVVAFVFQGVYPERADQYAGHFSRLHAESLAFSTDLGFETKQLAARQMLRYPGTLRQEPLLRFALARLDDGSPLSRAQYYAALPLGKLANAV